MHVALTATCGKNAYPPSPSSVYLWNSSSLHLSSISFKNVTFNSRLHALGIDKVHLVQDWGDPSFRESFHTISLVHAHMPRDTTMIALTTSTTLLAGPESIALLNILGLAPGSFFFQRRSNIRHDMRDIYRVLNHGIGEWAFLDLDWILESARKTIIYLLPRL